MYIHLKDEEAGTKKENREEEGGQEEGELKSFLLKREKVGFTLAATAVIFVLRKQERSGDGGR